MTENDILLTIRWARETGQTTLDLTGRGLTALPHEIGTLTKLHTLYLKDNQLGEIPDEIGNLTSLVRLSVASNRLTKLTPNIGKLTKLKALYLDHNKLEEIPETTVNLKELRALHLDYNKLAELPTGISSLKQLDSFFFDHNPLTVPPPPIVARGKRSVLAFLEAMSKKTELEWGSKLLLLGEGGVGKTQMLRRLLKKSFEENHAPTHGIEIHQLTFPHIPEPNSPELTVTLNTWDFGGQEIYHATHQFFLTNRSLFLLAWNARIGHEQSKLEYWLDTIKARAPESKVILVATFTDEHHADIPFADLQRKYPQIRARCEVSNKTGDGIDKLWAKIKEVALELPLMGGSRPATWLLAAEHIRRLQGKNFVPRCDMEKILSECEVEPQHFGIVLQWLHDLSDILSYPDDDELKDIIILKPQWVTQHIGDVLESPEVIKRLGVLHVKDLVGIWPNLTAPVRDHLLRLMERFDLSYRTLSQNDIIIVERLSSDAPKYEDRWNEVGARYPGRQIVMKFKMDTHLPSGVPTWFIARTHRFTTHQHWRYGALLTDADNADGNEVEHLGLIQAFWYERYVQLSVRGPAPHNFFALLRDGLELTLKRFPGLPIKRMLPCPGHDRQECQHEFELDDLTRAIQNDPPMSDIQCPKTFKWVSVPGLLFGLHWKTESAVIEKIESLSQSVVDWRKAEYRAFEKLLNRDFFLKVVRLHQQLLDKPCPSVFTLRPHGAKKWAAPLVGQKLELQLYCEEPGCWHPVGQEGCYEIRKPAEWMGKLAPHVRRLAKILKYVVPVIGPAAAKMNAALEKVIHDDVNLMSALVAMLPGSQGSPANEWPGQFTASADLQHPGPESLRSLAMLLDVLDPNKTWGHLRPTLTSEGHLLWLCEEHARHYAR